MAGSFGRRAIGALRLGAGARVTLLSAAFVLLVGGWQIARSRDVALLNAGGQARALVGALAEHAARTIDGVDLILTGVIDQIEINPDRSGAKALLMRRAASMAQVHKLAILSEDGSWTYDSVGPHRALSSADRAYFQWHRSHSDLGAHIDQPIVSYYDGKTVIPVSRRLNRPDGAFDGVVSATLSLDSFRAFHDNLKLGAHGAIALWLESGRLLAREPEAPAMMGKDFSDSRMFARELPAGPAGLYQIATSAIDGRERIIAFQRLPRYPVIVTAAIAVEDVLAPWRAEALIQGMVIAVAITALIGLGIGLERRDRRFAVSERASHDAQSLFRALFESSTDLQFVHRLDPDGGFRLEACNPAAAVAMGLSREEATGRRLEDLMPGQAAKVRAGLDLALVAEEPVRIENDIEVDGALKSVEVIQAPLRNPETGRFDRIFVGVRDITHLKVAEAKAREANRLLVMAEQIAHVGHWHIALPSQRITWSEEVFRIHGRDPASFTPTIENGIAAYHPDDRARVSDCVIRAIEDNEPFDFALRIFRPDGEVRHIHCRGFCQADLGADGKPQEERSIFGVFADITVLRKVERELAEKSELLEATLESMDQGLLVIDSDGLVPIANHRAAELLRLSPELLRSRPRYEAIRRALREGGGWNEWDGFDIADPRADRRRADGAVIEARAMPMRAGGGHVQTLTDVTERRSAVARLSESEARYRLLADNTSDLIALSDADDRQTYISPAVTTMLGHSVEEAGAIGLRSLVHPDDRDVVAQAIGGLGPDSPTASAVYRLRHKAGHVIWAEAAFRRIEGAGDARIIETVRDVTLRRQQSDHLESAKVAAEAGARVKAEFLANMSHELRTPLTGMLGVHELLQSDATLTASQTRLVRLAQESGRSLLGIVNDILDFSKIEAGQLAIEAEAFDLAALMESCGALSAEAAEGRGLAIAVEIDPDAPGWLVGDAARLRQVLLNLATNAVKFTHAGRVTLRALWREEAGAGRADSSGRLRIEVADTGIGIAADTLSRLFERFSQADGSISRHYGGTGLGLAICRRLVELMGGEIGVESALGEGSTFWLTLPLARAEAQEQDKALARAGAESHLAGIAPRSRRILVAEDNPINQEIIADVLRRKGHSVTMVGDGLEAIEAVRAGPAFDIVLMDIQMPGKDGLSATIAIRDWERETGSGRLPVVALTANAMAEEAERCRAAGMDAHVAKPIDWATLFATIERLVEAAEPEPVAAVATDGDGAMILDETVLETLADILGDHRIPGLLRSFADEIGRRMSTLSAPALTAADLASEAHALVSLAGQLGFTELSGLCRELEEAAADHGEVLGRLDELRGAAERALAAALRSRHAHAA